MKIPEKSSECTHARAWRLLAALVVFTMGAANVASAQPNCTEYPPNPLSPNDNLPDDCALQALLDVGGTIALQSGSPGYLLEGGLRIKVAGTRLIAAVPGQYPRIKAADSLNGIMIKTKDPVDNFEIGSISFDGNKAGRLWTYPGSCGPQRGEAGTILDVKGTGWYIHDTGFDNAVCGSSAVISGGNFNFYNNTITNSGYSEGGGPGAPKQYADGITIYTCVNSAVTHNRVYEATDVGIAVGLGVTQNCNVSANTVRNLATYAFAGISNGGPTAHTSSFVSGNVIESGLNLMSFGLWLGEGPWLNDDGSIPPPTPDVGTVSGNWISGAVVNLAADKVLAGSITGNVLYGARGSRGMIGCTWPAEFTYGSIGSAAIQPGGIYRTWQGTCAPYSGPTPSVRVTGPDNGSTVYTNQNLTISASASDPEGGAISRVEFFANGVFLGADTSAPYSWTVSAPLPPGSFDLTAVAYDGGGRGPNSNVTRVNVATFSLTNPAHLSTLAAGSYLTITSATTGPISFVDYWGYFFSLSQWVYLGRGTGAGFPVVVGPLPYGDYWVAGAGNGDTSIQTPWHYVYVR